MIVDYKLPVTLLVVLLVFVAILFGVHQISEHVLSPAVRHWLEETFVRRRQR